MDLKAIIEAKLNGTEPDPSYADVIETNHHHGTN